MNKWKLGRTQTLWLFAVICIVMIGSTVLMAMGYLTAPMREAEFTQTVTGSVLSVEQDGRGIRVVDLTWNEGAQDEALSMKQLYAQVSSASVLQDRWGSTIEAKDLPEGASVQLEIGRIQYRDEARTIASAKIIKLVLDPQ